MATNSLNWLVDNWQFLSQKRIKEIHYTDIQYLLNDWEAPNDGKFYGTEEFFEYHKSLGTIVGWTGTKRLLLHSYIVAPMPEERIKAIYINPKKYKFDVNGKLTAKCSYETTIFLFVN